MSKTDVLLQRWGVTAVTRNGQNIYFVSEAPTKRDLLLLLAALPSLAMVVKVSLLLPLATPQEAS